MSTTTGAESSKRSTATSASLSVEGSTLENSKRSTATNASLFAAASNLESIGSSNSTRHRRPRRRVKLTTNVRFDANRDAFKDIRHLLELFREHNIPGPLLLRTRNDFSLKVGSGGQGQVRAASEEYVSALDTLEPADDQHKSIWRTSMAQERCVAHWKTCVIKQLRSKNRKLDTEAASAVREVTGLCRAAELSKRSDYIVKLLGWGICLDALESGDLARSRLPFLVLERATCDMEQFIAQGLQRQESAVTKMNMGLEVGIGLFAIHTSKMAHGDMKLSNILVFPDPRKRWRVKICDFGSATEFVQGKLVGQYSGTDTWRPPESLNSTVSVDLQLCDVFAYGLVLWSWLIGLTTSPIDNLEGNQIQKRLGQQQFFHQAFPDIVKEFGEPSDIRWLNDESIYGRHGASMGIAEARKSRFKVFCGFGLPKFLTPPVGSATRDFESEVVSRILNTLSVALDELPARRSREPWGFLQPSASVLRLRPPKSFSRGNKGTETYSADMSDGPSTSETRPTSAESVIHPGYRAMQRYINWLQLQLGSCALIIDGSRRRLSVFQQFHRIFFEALGNDPNDISFIKHSDHVACDRLDQSGIDLLERLISPYYIESAIERWLRNLVYLTLGRANLARMWQWDEHSLYALARIRSRFPDRICWNNLFTLRPALGVKIDQAIADLRVSSVDTSLAWAFRNLTALDVPVYENEAYFEFLDDSSVTDKDVTFRLHLLMEKGFFLGQTYGNDLNAPSMFLRYLTRLTDPNYAIAICRHFRRISSLDGAIDQCKFYYTGFSDVSNFQTEPHQFNTCLHDAVRALNFSVVKYLITTDFQVDARDDNDMTASDVLHYVDALPFGLHRSIHHSRQSARLDRLKSTISSLFSDHEMSKSSNRDLPLGWEKWQTSTVPAYIETSTAPGTDVTPSIQKASEHPYPITFKRPSTGLYQNNAIALVKRQISETENESYLFNPLRFLRVRGRVDTTLEPVKVAQFDEAWYKADAVMLHQHRHTDTPMMEQSYERNSFPPSSSIRRSFHSIGLDRAQPLPGSVYRPPPLITVVLDKFEMWFIIILMPLSLAARYWCWSAPAQFYLSAFAFTGIYAGFWHVTGLWGMLSLDLIVAFFFSFNLDAHYTFDFVTGSILSSNLLTLGFAALSTGMYFQMVRFTETAGLALFDCTSFSVFGASFSYALKFHESTLDTESNALVIISRTIAIISLAIFVILNYFTAVTHSEIFDDEYTEDILQLREGHETEAEESPHTRGEFFAYSLISGLLGTTIAHNVSVSVAALADDGSINPTFAAMILLPVISKSVILFRVASSGWVNRFQKVIMNTVRLSLGHGLMIVPMVIILKWILGQRFAYDFDLGHVVFLFLQWRIIREAFYDGTSDYFQGLNLLALYTIFIMYVVIST